MTDDDVARPAKTGEEELRARIDTAVRMLRRCGDCGSCGTTVALAVDVLRTGRR